MFEVIMLPLFVFCGAASVHIAASYAIAQELAPPATAALFLPCAALAAAVLHAASYYAALPVLAGGQAATVSSEKAAHFWASTLACSLLAPTWLWHLVQAFGRLAGAYAAARGPWMTASQSLAAEDDVIILLLVGFYVYEIVLILTDVFPSKAAWLCHHGAALGIASYFLLAAREPVLRTTIVIGLLTHVSRPFRHAAFFAACLFGKGSAAAAYAGALFRVVLLFSDWPLIMAALAFYLAHGGASPLALLMGAPLVYAVSKWAWHDLLWLREWVITGSLDAANHKRPHDRFPDVAHRFAAVARSAHKWAHLAHKRHSNEQSEAQEQEASAAKEN